MNFEAGINTPKTRVERATPSVACRFMMIFSLIFLSCIELRRRARPPTACRDAAKTESMIIGLLPKAL